MVHVRGKTPVPAHRAMCRVDALAQNVEPAQTVVDKAHNHRNDYDCDYPADESVDES